MFDVIPSALPRPAWPGTPGGVPAAVAAAGFAEAELGTAAVSAPEESGSLEGESGHDLGSNVVVAEEVEAEATEAEPTDEIDQPKKHAARLFSELWRAQVDPENLNVFTEIVNPFTRSAMYRLPPLQLSEQAISESRSISRQEYQQLSVDGEV
ncbi:MAG: hypothetical protein KDA64_05580 [Rhodospirillaceae bacterium]|nr:hypothetical protein [Rhodospirillaceae bacterium]